MQLEANISTALGRFLAGALLAVSLVWLAGCPAEQSERCRTLCKELVTCVEAVETKLVIDENECTTTCTSLERDPEGKALVDEYAACVRSRSTCEEQLTCNQLAVSQ